VFVEKRRDYIQVPRDLTGSRRVAEERGKNGKRNLQGLNKRVESQKGTRQPCGRGVFLRPLSLALRDPPHQDLPYALLEREDHWIKRIEWQWTVKGNSSRSWDWR